MSADSGEAVVPRFARCGGQDYREDKPVRVLIRLVFTVLLPATTPAAGRRTTGTVFSAPPCLRASVLILSRALRPLLRGTLLTLAFSAAGLAVAVAQDHAGQYSPADIAAGARVYNAMCAPCHGPTGAGIGGIDLRRGPLPRAATDAALRAIITAGIPGSGMPSFRMDPNDLQSVIAFIRAGFDANASTLAGPSGDTARGRALFEGKANCLSCHRVNVKGQDSGPDLTEVGRARTPVSLQRTLIDPTGSMLPINRPVRAVRRDGSVVTGRRLNEDTYTVQIMSEQGRLVALVKADLRTWSVGTTSPMPSYKDTLTPGEMTDLVAYLASLKGSRP